MSALISRAPSGRRADRGPLGSWWFPACAITLVLVSDYEWRRRDVEASLSGQADLVVVLEVACYAAVAAYLLLFVCDPPNLRRRPPALKLLAWAYVATLAVSALWAPYPLMALVRGAQLVVVALLCQAAVQHAGRDALHRFVHGFTVLTAASAVVGVVLPQQRLALHTARFNWLFVHPVVAGTLLGLSVVALIAYLFARDPGRANALWPRGAYAALLAVNGLALLGTITRTAIGAAVVAGAVVALASASSKRRIDLTVFGTVALGLVLLLFATPILRFLERGETAQSLLTLNSRTTLWQAAWDMFTQQPLLGYGITAPRGLFLDTIGLGGAHNALVEVALSAGVVGLLVWVGLLALIGARITTMVTSRFGFSRAHPDGPLLLGLFLFLIINGISTEGAGTAANAQSLWLLLLANWVAVPGIGSARAAEDG